MARMIPENPVGRLPGAVVRVFRVFKGFPENWVIWHHLAPWDPDAPDFLLLSPSRQAVLVKVSDASQAAADSAAQLLLGAPGKVFGNSESETLNTFCQKLPDMHVGRVVLFPNIPERHLNNAPRKPAAGIFWWGQEAMHSQERWLSGFTLPPLEEPSEDILRQAFTPESVVPAALTVRPAIGHRLQAGLTDFLLDYDQEAVLKADLDLDPAGERTARDLQTSVVSGVAGSGKTLILLYRLRLLQSAFPHERFLVLTHNRPLMLDLQDRYKRLTGSLPASITITTFSGWCWKVWPSADSPWQTPISLSQREGIAQMALDTLKIKNFSKEMLINEIDWFKDQTFESLDDYLNADRRGRGFRLSSEQRRKMAQGIARYEAIKTARRVLDWADIPRLLREWSAENRHLLPQYDVILIDEAQFFAPIWFDLLLKALHPRGQLFIAADPTQGFLGRGASWKSMGLDVRGRTHTLQHSYRTTREILDFATVFFRMRQPNDDPDEDILSTDLLNMPPGPVPAFISLAHPQDEIARIANEVELLVRNGLPPKMILVLHHDWAGVEKLIAALRTRLGWKGVQDAKKQIPGDFVRVTTLNAGAGLEAPVVFLAGLHDLFEKEQSVRISPEEREKMIRDNTRKIYMAITRAGQRLVITYAGEPPPELAHFFLRPGSKERSP